MALALLLGTWSAAGAAAQAVQPEVRDVRFEGNESFPDDSLARAIITRPTECRGVALFWACLPGWDFAFQHSFLSRRELSADRNRLVIWYRQRGFRDAQVDTTVTALEAGVEVGFRIVEGEPVLIDSLRFTGPDSIVDRQLLDDLPLRVGDRLSSIALESARETIVSRLMDRGYAHAEVFRVVRTPAGSYRAAVELEIEPGPHVRFGEITVEGNVELSRSTVLRTLPFGPGDPYRASDLQEGRTRLFGLGMVRSVEVRDSTPFGEPVAPVHVRIREGEEHNVRAGAGWSNAECLTTEARWASRNFMGGGRTLELRARAANLLAPDYREVLFCRDSGDDPYNRLTWLASADFTHPWAFSTRNTVNASVFWERQSLPGIFVRTAYGGTLTLSRILGLRTLLRVSWGLELSRLDEGSDFLWCSGFLICTPEDVALLQSFNRLAPVGLNVTTNETDNILNPSDGYIASLDFEHAADWLGSQFRYDRLLGEASWYEGFTQGGVVAARLRGGWVGSGAFAGALGGRDEVGVIHPEKRFYAGGANSVRGFAQGRLGPRVLVVEPEVLLDSISGCTAAQINDLSCDPGALAESAFQPRPTGGTRVLEGNLELRFRVSPRFQAVTFADFGQVWSVAERVDLDTVEVTPGIGVRLLSPIGPLRVDLAYRFRGVARLPVVTSKVMPTGEPDPNAEIAVLTTRYAFGASDPLDLLRRLQIHFSIGQAF